MKIIKKGKPYRIHKCIKCKTVFAYKVNYLEGSRLIYCPECGHFMDTHLFDKKISQEKYDELKELEAMNKVDIKEYNTLVNKYNEIYKENQKLKKLESGNNE